jgi:hypothetical protein
MWEDRGWSRRLKPWDGARKQRREEVRSQINDK